MVVTPILWPLKPNQPPWHGSIYYLPYQLTQVHTICQEDNNNISEHCRLASCEHSALCYISYKWIIPINQKHRQWFLRKMFYTHISKNKSCGVCFTMTTKHHSVTNSKWAWYHPTLWVCQIMPGPTLVYHRWLMATFFVSLFVLHSLMRVFQIPSMGYRRSLSTTLPELIHISISPLIPCNLWLLTQNIFLRSHCWCFLFTAMIHFVCSSLYPFIGSGCESCLSRQEDVTQTMHQWQCAINQKLYESAMLHVAHATQWLSKHYWKVVDYLPYSPDLKHSDFQLFNPLEKHLSGRYFASNADTISCSDSSNADNMKIQIHIGLEETLYTVNLVYHSSDLGSPWRKKFMWLLKLTLKKKNDTSCNIYYSNNEQNFPTEIWFLETELQTKKWVLSYF